MRRRRWWQSRRFLFLSLLLLLFVPDPQGLDPEGAGREPFVWDRDELWSDLEARFVAARERGCAAHREEIDSAFQAIDARLDTLEREPHKPGDEALRELEAELFDVAPLLGACEARIPQLITRFERIRRVVKDQSLHWDAEDPRTRDQVYRLLYGGRMAVEELMLQMPDDRVRALSTGTDEPSATPSTELLGVEVHSGDILVSRGGAPTSALIARGNDYPGNFSHVALLHVDEETGAASVVEAHIERGVTVATLEQYLADTKLRVMVLRPRADLPALEREPMLPHHAAEHALREARARHIAYDFAMHYDDPETMFCSEVASSAYAEQGLQLWEGLSSMSSAGVTRWLAGFGVERFETHGPSDLEYDPKLRVVAEWRDPDTLFRDHVDNAVVDVMLEGAEAGDDLEYDFWRLPVARLAKAYSWVLNRFGEEGPVPEGMSATVALRAQAMSERHATIAERTLADAERWREEHGYRPPYWELVRLARANRPD